MTVDGDSDFDGGTNITAFAEVSVEDFPHIGGAFWSEKGGGEEIIEG